MTAPQLASTSSEVLDRPIRCEMLNAAELEARFKKGTVEVEDWYARSGFELLTQFADGRMGYMGTVKGLCSLPADAPRSASGLGQKCTRSSCSRSSIKHPAKSATSLI